MSVQKPFSQFFGDHASNLECTIFVIAYAAHNSRDLYRSPSDAHLAPAPAITAKKARIAPQPISKQIERAQQQQNLVAHTRALFWMSYKKDLLRARDGAEAEGGFQANTAGNAKQQLSLRGLCLVLAERRVCVCMPVSTITVPTVDTVTQIVTAVACLTAAIAHLIQVLIGRCRACCRSQRSTALLTGGTTAGAASCWTEGTRYNRGSVLLLIAICIGDILYGISEGYVGLYDIISVWYGRLGLIVDQIGLSGLISA
ncbi:hypothetical protein B0T21DRAFT_343959 [Apiosordaria backusii]|uniref:Uncharacterized protein n=1 Tax=Apiosordaria backusii TaxID=314023 RepID=A0AA40EZ91_9PEZI|nr:hypothetical protein B0T21DRAFT_343959 [Apiosordaria backusii]